MSDPIYLSTIGVQMFYAAEVTAGTRPTSGYTEIKGIKSTPALTATPDSLETTTMNETEYKTYIPGLKDLGGSLEFTFNLSQNLKDTWDALLTAYATAQAASKAIWFCITVPGLTNAVYFKGIPSPMGLPGMSVNAVAEATNTITSTNAPEWYARPTSA